MRGYIVVPQFWFYAKRIEDITAPPKGDAKVWTELFGAPGVPKLSKEQPVPSFGQIVFAVADDGTLVRVAGNIDSSG